MRRGQWHGSEFVVPSRFPASYSTPGSPGGFGAQISYYLGEYASNVATAHDGTGGGINAWYDKDPVHVGVGYGRRKYAAGDVVQRVIAGTYDFGVVKVLSVAGTDPVAKKIAVQYVHNLSKRTALYRTRARLQ